MTTLTHTQARILQALHNNGGSIRCEDLVPSDRSSVTTMEKKGLCRWIHAGYERSRLAVEITDKGIEALKGPIG